MKQQTTIVNDQTVNLWLGGEGEPLLLIHGGIGNAEAHWKHVWKQLTERYTVIALNLPSFGGTSPLGQASLRSLIGRRVCLMR